MIFYNRRSNPSAVLQVSPALALILVGCSPVENNQQEASSPIVTPQNDESLSNICKSVESGEKNMVEISEDICKGFEAHKDNPAHEERVIITLKEGAARPDLKSEGISIVSEMGNMPIIVATITANGLRLLSEREDIARIEPDGEMRALEN